VRVYQSVENPPGDREAHRGTEAGPQASWGRAGKGEAGERAGSHEAGEYQVLSGHASEHYLSSVSEVAQGATSRWLHLSCGHRFCGAPHKPGDTEDVVQVLSP